MKKEAKNEKQLNIAMIGHKHIPSREGGVEIVVEELSTRMVKKGYNVTCYNRGGKHALDKNQKIDNKDEYKGIKLKKVLTIDKKGLAASVERSELTNSDLRFEEALERRKDAILIAGEQAMQEKKVSARLETSAGG